MPLTAAAPSSMLVANDMSDEDDPTYSTLFRTGKSAFSLADMARFSKDVNERPIERLVADLPALLALPEAKYAIVALIVGRRMRASDVERAALTERLVDLKSSGDAELRRRCDSILHPEP